MNIVDKLQSQIEELQDRIDQIQEDCNHPSSARIIVPKGSTGNGGWQEDRYWNENTCGLCNKRWDEEQ